MLSEACVILFGGGVGTNWYLHLVTATTAVGTHPTGSILVFGEFTLANTKAQTDNKLFVLNCGNVFGALTLRLI